MQSFVTYVKNILSEAGGNKFTTSAISSFLASVKDDESRRLTEDDLRLWVVNMMLSGFKKSTRKRYFGKLSTLYGEWTTDGVTSPFGKVSDVIDSDLETAGGQADYNLDIVPRLLKKTGDFSGWEYINVFFYLLFDVEATMTDAINLRFDSTLPELLQIDTVIEAMRETRQIKYVFGLNRGAKREPQLLRELTADLCATLSMEGMRFGEKFSRKSITAIWIAAALRCRIPVGEICGIVRDMPDEYAFLSLIKPCPISEARKAAILKTVADSINNQTNHWFVMRMRQGYTPDDIKDAIIKKTKGVYDLMSFYYPTRTVVREGKGKKKIREEVPYIPGIMFFRTRRDQVAPLFGKIGDMAWCYRLSNSPDSPYSTISGKEMEAFQRHIGKFTDDIKMELVTDGENTFGVDDVVKINGGMLAGNIGVITAVHNQDGTVTYSLKLSTDSAFKWTVVEVENIFVEPSPNT